MIVASHGAGEERVLAEALTAGVGYVALVASVRRGETVRAGLEVGNGDVSWRLGSSYLSTWNGAENEY